MWVGDELWGAINVEEIEAGAFDEDDARLLQTVADQLGVGTALGAALRAARPRLPRHGRGARRGARGQGLLHRPPRALDRAVGRGGRAAARHGRGQLRDLRYGAVFHDIGKIAIPEAILNKQGPLNEAEREIMERHTIVGEQILAPVEFLADVRPIVRHEHERWDGGGYPDGLRGEQIPLGARIVLVCDAFHAMTSDRPYRAAMSDADARAELRAGAGTQFDPARRGRLPCRPRRR